MFDVETLCGFKKKIKDVFVLYKGAFHLSERAGQTGAFENTIPLLVRFALSMQNTVVVDLWKTLVEKGAFHIQNHRTGQPVLSNRKGPKSPVKFRFLEPSIFQTFW